MSPTRNNGFAADVSHESILADEPGKMVGEPLDQPAACNAPFSHISPGGGGGVELRGTYARYVQYIAYGTEENTFYLYFL